MKQIYITEKQHKDIFKTIKRIFITESQKIRLFNEGVEYSPMYKQNNGRYAVNMSLNQTPIQNGIDIDNRIFINRQEYKKNSEQNYRSMVCDKELLKDFREWAKNGKQGDFNLDDYPNASDKTKTWVEDNSILPSDEILKKINRRKLDYSTTYSAYEFEKYKGDESDTQNIENYRMIKIPKTNIYCLALFQLSDFNVSDALKKGYMRNNSDKTKKVLGVPEDYEDNIDVFYDDGIKPNIQQNFSLDDNLKKGHFKSQYQLQGNRYDTNIYSADDLQQELSKNAKYTSINQFLDKSIMYASYALKKEKFYPDLIVTPPSSSKFNQYYATNLSAKLGIEYITDFYQRNVLNVKKMDGSTIDEMINDGINPKMITQLKTWLETAAIRELGTMIGQPLKDFIQHNKTYFNTIRMKKNSRYFCTLQQVYQSVIKDVYNQIVNTINNDVIQELLINNMIPQKALNGKDKYIIESFKIIANKRKLQNEYQETIKQMQLIIKKYSNLLRTEGYKPKFYTKDIKITDLKGIQRLYVKDYFVIADENCDENGNILKKYKNSNILIFDEDMNSGATFKIAIDALSTKMFSPTAQNTLCLANGYALKGF